MIYVTPYKNSMVVWANMDSAEVLSEVMKDCKAIKVRGKKPRKPCCGWIFDNEEELAEYVLRFSYRYDPLPPFSEAPVLMDLADRAQDIFEFEFRNFGAETVRGNLERFRFQANSV